MGVAELAAKRSKDPNTKVGCCIVNKKNRIVATGYNGFPNGCDDKLLSWSRTGEPLKTKYPYVCHAEMNAILNKSSIDLGGCKLFSTLFPCNECAKLIIQSGITEIVYLEDKYPTSNEIIAAKRLFNMTKIQYCPLKPDNAIVVDIALDLD